MGVVTGSGAGRWPARLAAFGDRSVSWLDLLGDQLVFYARALAWTPRAIRRYTKEVLRLLAEVSFGSGALALIGGSVGVMVALTLFTGTVVGLEGMGVPSLPYLVTTRIVAGFVAVIPLYALGLVSSYVGSRVVTVLFNGQSAGTYDHYFGLFLSPVDVLWSFLKVMLFSVVVILIHCYYGYRASGGPAGVGVAVGRAVRTAIVMINIIDFFMSLAIWGATTTVRVAG